MEVLLCKENEATNCSKQMEYYKKVIEKYRNFRTTLYFLVPEAQMDKPVPLTFVIKNMTVIIPNSTLGYYRQNIFRQTIKYNDGILPYQNRKSDNTYIKMGSMNLAMYMPTKNTKSPGIKILTKLDSDITVYERIVNNIDIKLS